MKKLILVSGPSCVGKGPLLNALVEFHPEIVYGAIPVIKSHGSRSGVPRPSEVSIWTDPRFFRGDPEFALLPKDRYVVGDCRGYPQAIDIEEITQSDVSLLIMEVYHTIGAQFYNCVYKDIDVHSVFISPIALDDITCLKQCGVDTDKYIVDMMIHKQIQRCSFMGRPITSQEIIDIQARAKDAVREIESVKSYKHVIVNRDGEGNPNWNMNPAGVFTGEPTGDALRTLNSFVDIINHG